MENRLLLALIILHRKTAFPLSPRPFPSWSHFRVENHHTGDVPTVKHLEDQLVRPVAECRAERVLAFRTAFVQHHWPAVRIGGTAAAAWWRPHFISLFLLALFAFFTGLSLLERRRHVKNGPKLVKLNQSNTGHSVPSRPPIPPCYLRLRPNLHCALTVLFSRLLGTNEEFATVVDAKIEVSRHVGVKDKFGQTASVHIK